MNVREFIEQATTVIGFPATREKRFTLRSFPYFEKYEAIHLPANMSIADWWDAFNEYMAAQV